MAAASPALPPDDPWSLAKRRFLEELEPAERQLFNDATLDNIYSSTNNANLQDVENSKTRAVIRKLGPLISAIENYGIALDTFAQIAPLYICPIWGAIRVVLATSRAHAKFYDKIVDTLSRIGDILPRFRDYERIYDRVKHQRLTEALSNTYLDIIVICTKIRQCLRDYQASTLRRVFKPISLNRQIEDAVETFRRHKDNVGEEARVCHMIEAAEQRNDQLILAAVERRRRLISKLSNVDCQYRHQRLKKSRHEGTGVWLTTISEYQQWVQLESSAVLCCYGIPGCGKSVLASSILDNLSTTHFTIFYYCDYADKRTLDPSNIFGTLTQQLLESIDPIPEELALEIEQAPQDDGRVTNSVDAMKFLIKAMHLHPRPIHIIFDGVDEANEKSQKTVYQGFKELLIASPIPLKLLITGREEVALQLKLSPSSWYRRILISSTTITRDIENYVRASTRFRIVNGSLAIKDPDLELLIVEKLVTGAQGMFLWVEFQLNDLCEAESDHGIKIVLQNLPKNLSETYDRLLDRIEGSERREMIDRLFKWIVCARQPLYVDELREGVAFTLYDKEWSEEKITTDFKRLVRACSNLVVIDEESQIVELAHYTVQQYLLRPDGTRFNFTMEDANIMAGQICVAYLNFSNFDAQMVKHRDNASSELIAMGKLASRGHIITNEPARLALNTWNALRTSHPIPTNLDLAKSGLRPKPKIPDFSHFALLQYVKSHWLWHTRDFASEAIDKLDSDETRQNRLFVGLVFHRNLLLEFRPWGEFNEDRKEIFQREMLGWALNANHEYLVNVIWVEHLKNGWLNPHRMIFTDWKRLLEKHELSEYNGLLPRELFDYLEPLVDNFSFVESSTTGWLYSKAVSAARKDSVDVIEASFRYNHVPGFDYGGYTSCLKSYLLLEAAASGALSTVKALQKTIKDYWPQVGYRLGRRGNPLELAILAGHQEVVIHLCGDGFTAPNLLPNPQSYLRLLAEYIDARDVIKCLLYVQNPDLYLKLSKTQLS